MAGAAGEDAGPASSTAATQQTSGSGDESMIDTAEAWLGCGLQEYVDRYSGFTRMERLMAIVESASLGLARDALRLCMNEIKTTGSTVAYHYLIRKFANTEHGNEIKDFIDENWLRNAQAAVRKRQSALEADLENALAASVKENTRMALNDLGDYFYSQGEFTSAVKMYLRTRDYAANSKHQLQASLNLIRATVGAGNLAQIPSHIQRAMRDSNEDSNEAKAKLEAISGLAELWISAGTKTENLGKAATHFLKVGLELGQSLNDVLSCEDVALYGGMVALVHFSRSELQSEVLRSTVFRTMLEAAPVMHAAINDFVSSSYPELFANLAKLQRRAAIDKYLKKAAAPMFDKIRERAIEQYVYPFSSVDLRLMATAFTTDLATLEEQLAKLIVKGSLNAKLDRQGGFLISTKDDPRSKAYESSLQVGQRFVFEAHNAILTFNLNRRKIAVNYSDKGGGRDRRGGRQGPGRDAGRYGEPGMYPMDMDVDNESMDDGAESDADDMAFDSRKW